MEMTATEEINEAIKGQAIGVRELVEAGRLSTFEGTQLTMNLLSITVLTEVLLQLTRIADFEGKRLKYITDEQIKQYEELKNG